MWERGEDGQQDRARLLDLGRLIVADLGARTAAIVDTSSEQGMVVVAAWIGPGDRLAVAQHVLTHAEDAGRYGEAFVLCELGVCALAATWLPIALGLAAAGC